MARTTLAYLFVGLYVAAAAPVALTWALLTGRPELLFRLARLCIRCAGCLCGIRVRSEGLERLAPARTYLFMSNHQGNLDGPILFHTTGRDLRAVIKKEMMRIPILSAVFRSAGFVPIDRSDPIRARASIDLATRRLQQDHSFFAFPEGTRSRDGRLGEFKKGVFVMAIKAGVPVVPVSIRNSRALQPPGQYRIRPGCVDLIFHEPVATAAMRIEDRDQLLAEVRAAVLQGLL